LKPYTVVFIFARGGSKGVPRKNVRPLDGKPLIVYAIEVGLACPSVDKVVVSTDDDEIAEVARQYGAEVPFMRPGELAGDEVSEWLAWQHAVTKLQEIEEDKKLDVFVCLPATSPLRTVADVEKCIEELQRSGADMVYTVRPAACNPYYNMVELDAEGYARVVIPQGQRPHRRQDAPEVYESTTVAYAVRPEYVMGTQSFFAGRVKTVLVPSERALEIDTEIDFKLAEFMMREIRESAGADD
jgi:N,N'-diacetyl-8-epilegionaminate cytidylyltransferase